MLAAMKALVLESNARLAFRDVPAPARPDPGWALVRIQAAGVCGSDLHRAFEGGAYHTPLIMGHEMAGVIEEPAAAGALARGAQVVVFPLLPCRRCGACQTGDYAQCTDYDYFGSRRHGGFAEYLHVPQSNLLAVPDRVELLHASLTEPCAVALHGVDRLRVQPGDSACVFGGGPVGNLVAQWLGLRGCRPVFVVDIDREKLELARQMGFEPVDASSADPVAEVLARTGGEGADRVVEAVGLPRTFLQATQAAARFGQVVFLGNIRGQFSVGEKDFSSILRRELTILGTWNSRFAPVEHNDWTTVLDFMGRGIRIAELVSHTPQLEEGPEIFRQLVEGRPGSFRRVVFRVRP
jgi:L-iditol 2-dehydrogenase